MMRSSKCFTTLVALLVLSSLPRPLFADSPQLPPRGSAVYVMVLKEAEFLPADAEPRTVTEPDVLKYGGKVTRSRHNMRELLLPIDSAKLLRKEPSVAYLQRIWVGEPLDQWEDDRETGTNEFRVGTDDE